MFLQTHVIELYMIILYSCAEDSYPNYIGYPRIYPDYW